jgi:hypothetical protein
MARVPKRLWAAAGADAFPASSPPAQSSAMAQPALPAAILERRSSGGACDRRSFHGGRATRFARFSLPNARPVRAVPKTPSLALWGGAPLPRAFRRAGPRPRCCRPSGASFLAVLGTSGADPGRAAAGTAAPLRECQPAAPGALPPRETTSPSIPPEPAHSGSQGENPPPATAPADASSRDVLTGVTKMSASARRARPSGAPAVPDDPLAGSIGLAHAPNCRDKSDGVGA